MKSVLFAAALVVAVVADPAAAQDTPITVPIGHVMTASVSPILWTPHFVAYTLSGITVTTGTLGRDQAIITYPFTYRTPIRLKNDVHTFLHKISAGSLGFDGGEFALEMGRVGGRLDAVGSEHIMCFFRLDHAQPYAVPECLRYLNQLGVKWASAMVSNNVAANMSPGDPIFGTPDVEAGVAIPHDFSFQLMLGAWNQKAVHLRWMSDGREVSHADVPLRDDGTAVIDTETGTITLTHGGTDTSIGVAYVAKPNVAPSAPLPTQGAPAPKTVVVDGVVYTSGG